MALALCRAALRLYKDSLAPFRNEGVTFVTDLCYSFMSDCTNKPQKREEVQHFFENKSNFFSRPYSLITAIQILISEGIKKNPSQTLVHDGFFSSYSVFGYFSVKIGRLS